MNKLQFFSSTITGMHRKKGGGKVEVVVEFVFKFPVIFYILSMKNSRSLSQRSSQFMYIFSLPSIMKYHYVIVRPPSRRGGTT